METDEQIAGIHSRGRLRYTDVMVNSANDDSTTANLGRWYRLPRSLWMFISLQMLLGVGSIVCLGVADCRAISLLHESRRVGGRYKLREGGPNWLRSLIGPDWMLGFDEIVKIQLFGPEDAEPTLARLRGLKSLQELDLAGTQITDAGLINLKGMAGLKRLNLENTMVTDSGVEHLKELTHLEVLLICNCLVTDAGVENLKLALPDLNVDR